MKQDLNKYYFNYFFIKPPFVIFNALTTANRLFYFKENLEIPKEIGLDLIDCFFSLYDIKGKNIDCRIESVPSRLINYVANKIPEQMLETNFGIIQENDEDCLNKLEQLKVDLKLK